MAVHYALITGLDKYTVAPARNLWSGESNTHIIAIVLFRFSEGAEGDLVPNNYVVTAYQKEIG